MALEVNFYAGTRALYDAEPSLDPGGLYALIDGLGLYRGAQPIAGPCPFDINLLIEQTTEQAPIYKLSGGFQSSESVQFIKEFFASHVGNGGRPVRVKFTYTSGVPLNNVALDNVNLLMYNTVPFSASTQTGLIGSFRAIEFKPSGSIENELVSCVIYDLSLTEPDIFNVDVKEFMLSATDIPTSEVVASINENRDAIAALSTKLTNEINRATKAESDLDKKIDAETTRAEQSENDLDSKIAAEKSRALAAESGLQDKITENSSNTAANTDKINKNASDIENLTSKVNKNTSNISSINETVSVNTTSIEANTASVATIQTTLTDLDRRIDNIEAGGTGGPFWVDY